MTKFNTEVKKGRAGKTPLIILLFVALIVLILANLAIDGRNAHSRNEIKEKSAKSDLNIAANQIAKMERQSLINKQDIFKDSNKTVENDDSALDNFQDINEDDYDFQKDYEEYLRIEESKPLPQPAYQNPIPNKIKEKRSSDFEKALMTAMQKALKKITPQKIDLVKQKMLAGLVYLKDNPSDAAYLVGMMATVGFDSKEIDGLDEKIEDVSAGQVLSVAQEILQATSVTGWLLPQKEGE